MAVAVGMACSPTVGGQIQMRSSSRSRTSRRVLPPACASQGGSSSGSESEGEKIYIGKGQFKQDDPTKYPAKEDKGLFTGVTGGWAGGEASLQVFIQQTREEGLGWFEDKGFVTSIDEAAPAEKGDEEGSDESLDTIYVGKGRFIKDDKSKYPDKEDVGFMKGATGGFAGGEVGLYSFIDDLSREVALNKKRSTLKKLNTSEKPVKRALPLLMPGMTVKIVSESNPYNDFTGIVQRVVDGRAAVLFEGGCWDKLVSFGLEEVEKAAAPQGINPKSAILEPLPVIEQPPAPKAVEEEKKEAVEVAE